MNFEASDYLNDLNVDFGNVSPTVSSNTSTSPNDLYLFSQSEFLDLDVFASDSAAPDKDVAVKLEERVQPLGTYNEDSEQHMGPNSNSSDVKRKRNTAASARFRIKKKMKEQQMIQQSKDLQEKVQALEKKLKTVEMENKCLKSLIAQQNEQRNSDWLEQIKKRSIMDASSTPFQYTN
ncbi:Transcription factor zip1 [Meyerozyma sp. JA9]|nr:Transcription factor zip1 [Meyerozyma sp. JA9]